LGENPNGGLIQNADLRSHHLSTKELTVLPTVTKQALPNKEMNPYTLLQYKRYDMCSKYRLWKRTPSSINPRTYLDPVTVIIITFTAS